MADDLKSVSTDGLIAELRARGHAVCVFQKEDIASVLSSIEPLCVLQPSEIDDLAGRILLTISDRLEERLSELGFEALGYMMPEEEYKDAEKTASARKAAVDELTSSLTARGVDPEALDDIVHGCAEAEGSAAANQTGSEDDADAVIDEASARASNVNNEGLAGQVSYLIALLGAEAARERIEEAAKDWLAKSGPRNG